MLEKHKIGFYGKDWFAYPNNPSLYLTNMAVAPTFQVMGTGRAMMAEIDRLAKEQDRLAIPFDVSNSPRGQDLFTRNAATNAFTAVLPDIRHLRISKRFFAKTKL
jgi:GNAT superfamily N-acetyltransferase